MKHFSLVDRRQLMNRSAISSHRIGLNHASNAGNCNGVDTLIRPNCLFLFPTLCYPSPSITRRSVSTSMAHWAMACIELILCITLDAVLSLSFADATPGHGIGHVVSCFLSKFTNSLLSLLLAFSGVFVLSSPFPAMAACIVCCAFARRSVGCYLGFPFLSMYLLHSSVSVFLNICFVMIIPVADRVWSVIQCCFCFFFFLS